MKTENKKKITAALAVVLVLTTIVGVTLALLSARSDDKVNTFTVLGSDDIDYEIEEPGFEPGDGDDMIPNVPVTKDPYGINQSDELSIWAAMQIVVVDGSGHAEFDPADVLSAQQYELLMEYLHFRYDISESPSAVRGSNLNTDTDTGTDPALAGVWMDTGVNDGSGNGAVYVWSGELAAGAQTEALFKDVMLDFETDSEILDWINGKADYEKEGTTIESLHNFSIIIRGAAVQYEGVSLNEASAALTKMLNYWD